MAVEKKYAKIINEETHEVQVGVGCPIGYYIEIGMTWMEVEYGWDSKWYQAGYVPEQPEPTPPTYEEVKKIREDLYKSEVDPITAHIQRLRDQEQTELIKQEIEALVRERDNTFINIQIEHPYPVGE